MDTKNIQSLQAAIEKANKELAQMARYLPSTNTFTVGGGPIMAGSITSGTSWTVPVTTNKPQFSGLKTEMAMGEIYGLRMFGWDEYGRLRARNIDSAPPWRPGVNIAQCIGGLRQFSRDKHDVPNDQCTCGFYAYTDPAVVRFDRITYPDHIIGAVKCYGRVLIGTKGFRAEKAEIVMLRTPRNKSIADKITRAYPQIPQVRKVGQILAEVPIESTLPDPATEEFWTMK